MACEAGYTEIASVLMDAGAGDNLYIISYKKLDHFQKTFFLKGYSFLRHWP